MQTWLHFLSHLAEFFSEWEIFRIKFVEKIKTHILCSSFFSPRKSCRLRDNVEKCGRARQTTDDDIMWRIRFACWRTKATNTHSEYVILLPTSHSTDLLLGELIQSMHFMPFPFMARACMCCECRTPWDVRWNKQSLTAGEKLTLSSSRQMHSSYAIKLPFFQGHAKTNTCIVFWKQCICSYSSCWSSKKYTLVPYSLEKKITSSLYEGPPPLKVHCPSYRVLLPLASLVISGVFRLFSLTGLQHRTKCWSCVTEWSKQFVGSLFDPKFYSPCNKNNLYCISYCFSKVWISLGGENRNLLSHPLSLPWSSSSSSSSMDLQT